MFEGFYKATAIARGFIFFIISTIILSCSKQPLYPSPQIIGDMVVIDLALLREETPLFYSYNYNNKRINFFVIKIHGEISSYLDACYSCYPKKLGFGFDNGYIYCRSCNVRYSISDIKKGIGSCYPIKIPGELGEGRYFIPIKILQEGANKF